MQVSKLHFYTYGKVAANKPLKSRDIEFWAAEISPAMDGEITDRVDTYEAEGEDSMGGKFKLKADTSVTLHATWFPFGNSNRLRPPDVRRGEAVVIWQFADDQNNLYWSEAHDISLRRLETFILAISADPKEDQEPNENNTYFLEMSSHEKILTIHTSKTNGEPFAFDIQINAGAGNVVIKDDIGNFISMDSKENHLEMVNADGSLIEINKTKGRFFTPDQIDIESKVINIKASNALNTETKTMTTKNDTWQIESETTHTGNLTENGMLGLNGNMTTAAGAKGGTGKVTIGADVEISETVTAHAGANFGGVVTAKKIVSEQAIDAPNV